MRGFTLIELLLTMAIFVIIAALATPFLSNFVLRNNYEVTQDFVISSIRKAQSYSISGKNNSSWGVCSIAGKIRLFRGTCTAPTFSEDFKIPNTVTVTGLTETTFSKMRGEPSGSLNINITSSIGSKNVKVNLTGGMDE